MNLDIPTFPLPLPFRALNMIAARLPQGAERLHPDAVLEAVERSTGDARLLPARVTEALAVLCRSCVNDANLHPWGRLRVFSLLKDAMEQRALLERAFLDRPALASQALVPPLVVTGLFRSGTTFLHRMLAEAEGARSVTLADFLQPFARPGQVLSPRREVQLKFALFHKSSSPELDAMHYMRPDLAEECVVGMRLDLRSLMLWRSAPIMSYHEWLVAQDLTETYAMHRRLLQHFQAAAPGVRLALKAPMHLLGLGALLAVFPEALVVHTHRDPLECVPSDHKLAFGFHGGVTAGVDPAWMIETNTRGLVAMAEHSVAVRETPAGQRVHDVNYRDLVRDPLGTVRAIYQRFALPFSTEAEERVRTFVRDNPQYKHGPNPYTIEQFGQTAAELARRFARYRQRFLFDAPAPAPQPS